MALYTRRDIVAREVDTNHGSSRWGLDCTEPYRSSMLVIRSREEMKMTTNKFRLNWVKEER